METKYEYEFLIFPDKMNVGFLFVNVVSL